VQKENVRATMLCLGAGIGRLYMTVGSNVEIRV
jgi:hypothetical protein